jgi:site-specific recombinase XerD
MRVVKRAPERAGEPDVALVDDSGAVVSEVSAFLRSLAARDYSPNTIRAYAYDLMKLLQFLDDRGAGLGDFSPVLATEFLAWLRAQSSTGRAQRNQLGLVSSQGRRLSARTCNRVLAAVSSFYEFVISCGGYTSVENPILRETDQASARVLGRHRPALVTSVDQRPVRRILRVRTVETLPRPIPDEIYLALLAQLERLRDRALLELMHEGGLRPGEVLGLHLEDLSYGRKRVTVRHRTDHPQGARQKSRRDRVVDLLEDRALPTLNRYVLLERPQDVESPLVFLIGGRGPRRGQALSYDGLVRMFQRAATRAGVRDAWLTPHSLRHTHATRMSELGMRELTLQRRLGHAHPDSTQVYIRVTDHQVRDEYRAALEQVPTGCLEA